MTTDMRTVFAQTTTALLEEDPLTAKCASIPPGPQP